MISGNCLLNSGRHNFLLFEAKGRRQKSGVRRQETEVRRQETEVRSQETEVRRHLHYCLQPPVYSLQPVLRIKNFQKAQSPKNEQHSAQDKTEVLERYFVSYPGAEKRSYSRP
jgi:hypothetical protein